MDFDYRENIAGSPFVDEGWADRLGASSMATLRRGRALAGHEFQGLNHEKIKYLFDTFESKVKKTMMDFADPEKPNNVYNRLSQITHPRLNEMQQWVLEELHRLYELVSKTSPLGRAIGSRNISRQSDPTQPANKTAISNVQAAQGTPYKGALSEIVGRIIKEGTLSVLKAIQSNNPSQILSAYLSELKSAHDTFYADAKRTTGLTDKQIEDIVANLYPQTGDPRFVKEPSKSDILMGMKELFQYIPTLTPPKPQVTGSATSGSVKPNATVKPVGAGAAGAGGGTGGGHELPPDDYTAIVIKTAEIIVAAVKADTSRSEDIMNAQSLSPSWGQPIAPDLSKQKHAATTNEAAPAPDPDLAGAAPAGTPTSAEVDFDEAPDEFVYNFRGKLRKSRHFSIEVPAMDNDIVTDAAGTPKYKLRVIWENDQSHNIIRTVYQTTDATGKLGPENMMVVFDFYDSLVYNKVVSSKDYSIEKLISNTGPTGLTKVSKANPTLQAELKTIGGTDAQFRRALVTIVHRKGMEFKAKPGGLFTLTFDKRGTVTRHFSEVDPATKKWTRGGKEVLYQSPEKAQEAIDSGELKLKPNETLDNLPYITTKIYSADVDKKDRDKWRKSLEHAGYFSAFPYMATSPKEDVRTDAIAGLVNKKFPLQFATNMVDKAIKAIPIINPKVTPANITTADIFEWINEYPEGYPKYLDTISDESVTMFGMSPEKATNTVRSMWDGLPDDKWIEAEDTIRNKIIQGIKEKSTINQPELPVPSSEPKSATGVLTPGTIQPDGDGVVFVDKKGKEFHWDLTQTVAALANPQWKSFRAAMEKTGLFDKYKDHVEAYLASKKPKSGTVSEFINPFQRDNFL